MTEEREPATTDRRRRLLGIKLRALASDHLGTTVDVEPVEFGTGAGLVVDHAGWVIVDGPAGRTLGASLAWAIRNDATSLDVITDDQGGQLARRARGFDFPIRIWFPEGRTLLPVIAEELPEPPQPPPEHLDLIPVVEAGGARPHTERGVVSGEVRGLEVCRVVDEPTIGHFAELNDVPPEWLAERADAADGVILEVGVGANDREAFQLIHGHRPTQEALADVVTSVAAVRSVDAPQHPLNRMAPERFLRWQVEEDPGLLGLTSLRPVDPPVDRRSMKHPEPCVARGVDPSGAAVVVVFSAGVDLDLIPFVADVCLGLDEEIERVVVALPRRDLVPITGDLAALLVRPVEFVSL